MDIHPDPISLCARLSTDPKYRSVGVYSVKSGSAFRFGSGNFFRVNDVAWFLTAKHVVEQCRKYEGVYVGGRAPVLHPIDNTVIEAAIEPLHIPGPWLCEDDPLDLAVSKHDPSHFVDRSYVDIGETGIEARQMLSLDELASPLPKAHFYFVNAVTKQNQVPYQATKELKTKYTALLSPPSISTYHWFSTDEHFALSVDEDAISCGAPLGDPYAFSGSLCWAVTLSGEPVLRIAGVIRSWDRNTRALVGTRVERVSKLFGEVTQ